MTNAISLFSGPGGSSTGLKWAGVSDVIGVEWDDAAVATARAAGHTVMHGDVREISPHRVYGMFPSHTHSRRLLLQGSPPCQGLSMAGKGAGREDLVKLFKALDLLINAAKAGADNAHLRYLVQVAMHNLVGDCSDERSPLTFEVVRWLLDLMPEQVMLEQVPAALPIWEKIKELLEALGYSVWCGNVQAEQYGVPQTRKRAMLLASLDGQVVAPVPTHSKYHTRTPSRLDAGVCKWVSMAEALGWGSVEGTMVSNYGSGGDPSNRGERTLNQPAPTVTSKIDRNKVYVTHMGDVVQGNGTVRPVGAPAPTLTASMDNGNFRWVEDDSLPEAIVGAGITGEGRPRTIDNPTPTITGKGTAYWLKDASNYDRGGIDRKALVEEVEPRVNNQSGTEFDLAWPADRPSPVIAGRGLVTMPGANANRFNGSTKSRNDGIRVTVEEAGVLQSFPHDYPWTGTKTERFQQVGNAVPPLLQAVLTAHLLECANVTATVVGTAA